MSFSAEHTTADIAAIRGELESLQSILLSGGKVTYRASFETNHENVLTWLKENNLIFNHPDESKYVFQYSKLKMDEDDKEMIYSDPQYNMIFFATQDQYGFTIPRVYFVPKDVKLPDSLTDMNTHQSFLHCTYQSETDMTGAEIENWLTMNSAHVFDQNTTKNRMFIIASNEQVRPKTCKSLSVDRTFPSWDLVNPQ